MDATKHPKQFEKFPHAVTDWDDPDHLFDWTIEYRHFELAELNDYQRILHISWEFLWYLLLT
jgi:hypothetical protein